MLRNGGEGRCDGVTVTSKFAIALAVAADGGWTGVTEEQKLDERSSDWLSVRGRSAFWLGDRGIRAGDGKGYLPCSICCKTARCKLNSKNRSCYSSVRPINFWLI
ncbi:hypothetical protein AAHE18_03G318200 [Arachis hypogaea]